MAYSFFLDGVQLPIAPPSLSIKIKNQNKTITLINEGEVNILKMAGLTEISFKVLIPQTKYPFAVYPSGFKSADYVLNKLEQLKTGQSSFQFIVSRVLPNGKSLFDTNIKVSLEDYKIEEDSKEGFDVVVEVRLKQHKNYSTKTVKGTQGSGSNLTVNKERERDKSKIGIGSDVIVNGRLHRDSYGNGAGQTRTNYRGKINFINLRGSHPYHVTTPEGAWQGWVIASAVQGI